MFKLKRRQSKERCVLPKAEFLFLKSWWAHSWPSKPELGGPLQGTRVALYEGIRQHNRELDGPLRGNPTAEELTLAITLGDKSPLRSFM